MSEQIVQLNEQVIKSELKELVRQSVQEVFNMLAGRGSRPINKCAQV